MTVCKYYQQGNCRFGNRCWNEHIDTQTNRHHDYNSSGEYNYNDAYYKRYHYHNPRYSPSPPPRSPFSFSLQKSNNDSSHYQKEVSFSFNKALADTPTRNQFTALGEDTEKLVNKSRQNEEIEFIKDDMTRWELGKQWPFSCYAPVKVCIPAFKDISPEELRWQYYDAKESGTLHIHLQTISEYAEEMKLRRNELKNASPQLIEKLKSLQTEEKQQNSTFSFAQGTDFRISDDKHIFGLEKTPSQKFGSSRDFKFTLSNVSEQPKSPFRLLQFGAHDDQRNMFGNNSQTTKMETSVFGLNDKENEKSFSQNTGNSAFALSSPFVQQKDYSVNVQTSTVLSDKFLDGNSLETTVIGNIESIYTDLKLLNKEEKEEYTSNLKCFVLGRIPVKPPPKEICF